MLLMLFRNNPSLSFPLKESITLENDCFFVICPQNCNMGSFKNHVDNWRWVGGPKLPIFVHAYYIKSVHRGRWVVRKG